MGRRARVFDLLAIRPGQSAKCGIGHLGYTYQFLLIERFPIESPHGCGGSGDVAKYDKCLALLFGAFLRDYIENRAIGREQGV